MKSTTFLSLIFGVLLVFLVADKAIALECYECTACSSVDASTKTLNCSTSPLAVTGDEVFSCHKTGGDVAGVESWNRGCALKDTCSSTNADVSVVSSGIFCCDTDLCNFSISLVKSSFSLTTLLGLAVFLTALIFKV